MNYAEDNRVIGGIVAAIALGVYLFFFEKRELTLLLSVPSSARSTFALEAVLSYFMLEFTVGAMFAIDELSVPLDGVSGLGRTLVAISEWAIVIASAASVGLVFFALKGTSEDVFAGPRA